MDNQNLNHECTKDFLKIESFSSSSSSNELKLCGNYKEFKEFYAKGTSFKLNLTTDEFLSRRGFLIKISPTSETKCPHGTQRFDSKKCIKYFGDEENIITKRFVRSQSQHTSKKLNWHDAKRSCESHHNGRLMIINDFVENLKLNAFIRNRLADTVKTSLLVSTATPVDNLNLDEEEITSSKISFWSSIPFLTKYPNSLNIKLLVNATKKSTKYKCMTKRLSFWQEEACESKQAYICEYDALDVNPKKSIVTNGKNRLIRVACGTSATHFSETTTTTTKISTRTKINSIKNTQKPFTNLFLPFTNNLNYRNKLNLKHSNDDASSSSMMILTPKETLPLMSVENNKSRHVETILSQMSKSSNENSFLNGTDLGKILFLLR